MNPSTNLFKIYDNSDGKLDMTIMEYELLTLNLYLYDGIYKDGNSAFISAELDMNKLKEVIYLKNSVKNTTVKMENLLVNVTHKF